MKLCVVIVIIATVTAGFSHAEDHVSSDFVVLSEVLSLGIQKIVKSHSPFHGKTVFVSYPHGIVLSSKTKETVEALFTGEGFSVTLIKQNADYTFSITITDLRLLFLRKNKHFNRTVAMNIHIKCMDASRKVIFASGHEETYTDIITGNNIRYTDDCKQFSEEIQRQFIKKKSEGIRMISFVLITGILIFFAFQ